MFDDEVQESAPEVAEESSVEEAVSEDSKSEASPEQEGSLDESGGLENVE